MDRESFSKTDTAIRTIFSSPVFRLAEKIFFSATANLMSNTFENVCEQNKKIFGDKYGNQQIKKWYFFIPAPMWWHRDHGLARPKSLTKKKNGVCVNDMISILFFSMITRV